MGADDKSSGLVQGTLYMLILKTLALEPMHGYGIGLRLEQISRGVFQVNAGSLFPALRRLERDAPHQRATGASRRTTAAPSTTRSPRRGAPSSSRKHATGRSRRPPFTGSCARRSESCNGLGHTDHRRTARAAAAACRGAGARRRAARLLRARRRTRRCAPG